jgi:hypothetical protein
MFFHGVVVEHNQVSLMPEAGWGDITFAGGG